MSFYTQQRLQHQVNMVEKSYGDREAMELWAELQVNYQNQTVESLTSNVRMTHVIHVISSGRSHSFSKMWKLSLLFFMVTYGEATWLSLLKALSSLTHPPFMAIQSLSWALRGCLGVSTTLFTLPTIRRFLKHQALQKEISFTNSSII